jgi:hypothetical protein
MTNMKQNTKSSAELKLALTDIHNQITNVETNLEETNSRMERVEKTANDGLLMATQNRKTFSNMLKQGKLDNLIEITGIPQAEFSKYSSHKELAMAIIRSFSIQVDASDIQKAVKKEIEIKRKNAASHKVPIVIVTFSDFDKKLQVMQQKRKSTDPRNIYFNIALTPLNGFLMRRAKAITKGKNLRVYFGDESVRVKTADGTDMLIQDEKDLKPLQLYIDSLPLPSNDAVMRA